MDGKLIEIIERVKHNEKARKNIEKFINTGELFDDNGKEIKIGETVNYGKPRFIKD